MRAKWTSWDGPRLMLLATLQVITFFLVKLFGYWMLLMLVPERIHFKASAKEAWWAWLLAVYWHSCDQFTRNFLPCYPSKNIHFRSYKATDNTHVHRWYQPTNRRKDRIVRDNKPPKCGQIIGQGSKIHSRHPDRKNASFVSLCFNGRAYNVSTIQ